MSLTGSSRAEDRAAIIKEARHAASTYYGHNCLVVALSNETCEEERMRLGPDIERTTVTYTAKWEATVQHQMVTQTYGHDYCTGCKKERPDL